MASTSYEEEDCHHDLHDDSQLHAPRLQNPKL